MIRKVFRHIIRWAYPEIRILTRNLSWDFIACIKENVTMGVHTTIYPPFHINNSSIGDYTYISHNSNISITSIGKFCSIGPFLVCGWGVHPTGGISTSPMFYSSQKQNGMTLSPIDKIAERKPIKIGNDVFIGANVTILDGITIGDGAIIGAGAVVSKDIPPYAIAFGSPIQINRYRFDEKQIEALRSIKWWDFDEKRLQEVEKMFFDIDQFIKQEQKCIDGEH